MLLTSNQILLITAIHIGQESDLAGSGTYDGDIRQLTSLGLIEDDGPDEPGHHTTVKASALMEHLRRSADAFIKEFGKLPPFSTSAPPPLVKLENHPRGDAMQIVGEEPFYMVANGICRQQDCRPEPALVGPAISVYATERQASHRAIELAVNARGTHVFVLKSVAMYEVDPQVKPSRTYP